MARMAEDLTHLFDEQGIDRDLYESDVSFEDPLTKYDNIDGYLFNIGMLKNVFTPTYTMHAIEQTGDWELSTLDHGDEPARVSLRLAAQADVHGHVGHGDQPGDHESQDPLRHVGRHRHPGLLPQVEVPGGRA